MSDRARQFMPFAALKGYYDMIEERKREKTPRRQLGEDAERELSEVLCGLKRGDMVRVVYYSTDAYVEVRGMISMIDFVMRRLTVVKTEIEFKDIFEAEKETERE